MDERGWFRTAVDGDGTLVLRAGGQWRVATAASLDPALRRLDPAGAQAARIDLAAVDEIDSTGAWLLLRTRHELAARGLTVALDGVRPDIAPLLGHVEEGGRVAPLPHPVPAHHSLIGFLAGIGESVADLRRTARDLLGFFGLVCITLLRLLSSPRRLRFTALVAHMEQTGVNAIPIVGLLAFLIGVVFAYQGADQLRRFGAEIYTVNLLGISILRELGVVLTSIIVAGRSGSAFTAQIGTMKVNEEVDALDTLGLDPIEVLVVPRLLALMITLPLLTFFANAMGLLGGALMSYFSLDILIPTFLRQLRSAITGWTFWVGVVKAPVFAAIIALTGCYEGLRASRSAESVGRLTTNSVVESIFLIILFDAGFSIIFSILGI